MNLELRKSGMGIERAKSGTQELRKIKGNVF